MTDGRGRAIELLYLVARSAAVLVRNVVEDGGQLAGFDCRVVVEFGNGTDSPYELHVFEKDEAGSPLPSVRESVLGQKLPSMCPMRHINEDGSFCLGWRDETWLRPQTEDEAAMWWNKLRGYLRLQEYAQLLRRWPEQLGWPHGNAARYQAQFEVEAKGLPETVVLAVKEAAVGLAEGGKKVAGRRRSCPCGSGRRIKDCHEEGVVRLLGLVFLRDKEEAAFSASMTNHVCCGTMDNCPLQGKHGH
jgi:hypothetical protein